jgi:hypothetical protein
MAASVFIEQGATTMAAVSKLPLATQAPMSAGAYERSAKASSAAQFVVGVEHARRGDDEVRFNAQCACALQQPHAVNRATGAGDADDQTAHVDPSPAG